MAFDFTKITTKAKELPMNFLKACNPDPQKAGKSLMVLNALGMLFAAASDTFAAAIDKNTPAEEKKFLIPAGVATGAAKIGLYYLMTDKIIKGLKGSAQNVVDNMSSEDLAKNATEFAKNSIEKAQNGFLKTGLFKKSDEYISSMKNTLFKDGNIAGEITQKAKDLYKNNTIAAGGVLGAFIGAVIGCSIITPIIRDVSAYFVQKKMAKKLAQNPPQQPKFDPSRVGESVFNNSFGAKPMSMKNYMALTGGNMKI